MMTGGNVWRLGLVAGLATVASWRAGAEAPTMEQMLGYPFVSGLVRSEAGDRMAWVESVRGVKTVWVADAAGGPARKAASTGEDDGQEITGLAFTPDASRVLYVRGGAHDANWDAEGHLAPDPTNDVTEPKVTIWMAAAVGDAGAPVKVAEGDGAVVSHTGQVVYLKDGQVWAVALPGAGASEPAPKAERLFFDRGKDDGLVWSPDGTRLAFVSNRGDHSFIGIWEKGKGELRWMAPSTSEDSSPVWSPDGREVAWMRQPSAGGVPHNFLEQRVLPFGVWAAPVETGVGRRLWQAPRTVAGNMPDITGDTPFFWMAEGRVVFRAETDGWPHLWSVDAKAGGEAKLLTPGSYMVEDVAMSPDRRELVYSANTGAAAHDNERRHLYRLRGEAKAAEVLTKGEGMEWGPVALAGGRVGLVEAGPRAVHRVALQEGAGAARVLETGGAKGYNEAALVVPRTMRWTAPDGTEVEGQVFEAAGARGKQPGVVFVHGGPPRQMLLGWHMMDVYANAYAVNEWLALHGVTVLSINYRLGIGYGQAFQHPAHAGIAGAAEYQDVLSGARFLAKEPGVDAGRIGIYGASYGGYLTGLALARNSDVFKAGVDQVGLWNWLPAFEKYGALPEHWWQVDAGWQEAAKVAVASSPVGDVDRWKSPVLLIHGDDDRNVQFDQTVMAAYALGQRGVKVEELVLPNEIHSFLLWGALVEQDERTVEFLGKELGAR